MRGDPDRSAAAAVRLAIHFGFLLLAFVAAMVTHSSGVFVVVMALGLVVGLGLRRRNAFVRK